MHLHNYGDASLLLLLLLLLLQVLDESCYCVHPPNRLRGAAAVDILVLKALGLSVLPLPVAEWQQLEGDAAKQQKYLKARLAAAIGSPG